MDIGKLVNGIAAVGIVASLSTSAFADEVKIANIPVMSQETTKKLLIMESSFIPCKNIGGIDVKTNEHVISQYIQPILGAGYENCKKKVYQENNDFVMEYHAKKSGSNEIAVFYLPVDAKGNSSEVKFLRYESQ